jgi:hypothetical protein
LPAIHPSRPPKPTTRSQRTEEKHACWVPSNPTPGIDRGRYRCSVLYRTAIVLTQFGPLSNRSFHESNPRCFHPTIETQENCGLAMILSHTPVGGYLNRKNTLRRPQKTATFLALTLRAMVDKGVPLDLTRRKATLSGLEYLLDNLSGVRRGTQKHDRLMRKVATSDRPLATARTICKGYAALDQIDTGDQALDSSDVQELWVKVFKRQGRLIYPEQERIRQLDRSAIQGNLNRSDFYCADKVLRMFKAPGTLHRSWAKSELLADLALSGGDH